MGTAIRQRAILLVPTLLVVSVVTFSLTNLVPGDPALAVVGQNGSAQDYQRVRGELGLDDPFASRYLDWLGGVVRGDLGDTLVPPVERVWDRLARALPVSLELAVLALAIAALVALPVAMWSAHRATSRFDRAATAASMALISIPSFLAAFLLVMLLVLPQAWFPRSGWVRLSEGSLWENLRHAFVPALAIALPEIGVFTRVLRNDMITTLQEDFIVAARAKGLSSWHVLLREALRPSSFSLLTLAGVSLGRVIGGAVIVETMFGLPGMGRTIVDGALRNDYTLVQGGVLLIALVYLAVNTGIDLGYSALDPRIRRDRG